MTLHEMERSERKARALDRACQEYILKIIEKERKSA